MSEIGRDRRNKAKAVSNKHVLLQRVGACSQVVKFHTESSFSYFELESDVKKLFDALE